MTTVLLDALTGANVACEMSPRKALGHVALPNVPPDALRNPRAPVGAAHTGTVDPPPIPRKPSPVTGLALRSPSPIVRSTARRGPLPISARPPPSPAPEVRSLCRRSPFDQRLKSTHFSPGRGSVHVAVGKNNLQLGKE